VALARWTKATGTTSWTAMAARLGGIQQAELANKESMGLLPLSIHAPKPGHPGFADVVGQDSGVKRALKVISVLRVPDKYKKMGAAPPKGVLLTGGPGCGKTHLARAMAGEAGVSLLLADCAAMARKPELISAVFTEARRQAPCLLFLDELDAIGTVAKGAMGGSPDPDRQAILNRLLTELDGFEGMDGVMVIGATHRSELLDAALIRAGRLGIHISLNAATRVERVAIWKHYAKHVNVADAVNWERIARISSGMTPADIAQAMNVAAMSAVEDGSDRVGTAHLVAAVDEALWGGSEHEIPMQEQERWATAVHEAGHALLAWRCGQEIDRASIRPTHTALGWVRTIKEEGKYSDSQGDVLGAITMVFGGLAAETVVFGQHGSGVSEDLTTARAMVRRAIRRLGMSPDAPAGFPHGVLEPIASDAWTQRVELLETELLRTLRAQAVAWLTQERELLEHLAQALLTAGELEGEEIQALIEARAGERPTALLGNVANDISLAAKAYGSVDGGTAGGVGSQVHRHQDTADTPPTDSH
jgi:cell division protease FtsH